MSIVRPKHRFKFKSILFYTVTAVTDGKTSCGRSAIVGDQFSENKLSNKDD